MKILCVAEKPSIAKSISQILSSGNGLNNRPGKDKYCRNYEFHYRMPPGSIAGGSNGDWVDMVVTSVKGHLMASDFPESYKKWTSCSPNVLFTAPIETFVSQDCKQVAQNLKAEVRGADLLMIWTDCDREGEHIGTEVVKVCRQVNSRIRVKRAKFSAIIANQIHRAAQNPVELDWRAAEAVESRIELDLRLGAAFTRMQCLSLQAACSAQLQSRVISYGPCQFPTLGFVVDRYIISRDFIPQPFWYIAVMDKRQNMQVDFKWSRNHLFEKQAVQDIYARCRANPDATVTKVTSKQTRKFKPTPLTTVELQKSASRLLRMSPKRVLDVAEKLYQQGILSYPRTETDQYDKDFDFHALINKQKNDTAWGPFATRLADSAAHAFEKPVNGRKNDQAHPPIHPTKYANDLAADEKRVYEYVTRRFLASCSKHAVGNQTTVELNIAGEVFTASGIVVVERNYLDVYTFDKWGGPALPEYHQGERFRPKKMEMKEGETTRPKLLTEADLVSLMDRNGIGTDATIAEHISKIVERDYVKMLKEGQINYLIPSELGMGLVEGYNAIDFDGNKSLCKPLLRRETEERLNLICQGTKTRQETVEQSLQEYKAVFDKAKEDISKLIDRVNANLRGEYAQGEGSVPDNNRQGDDDLTVGGNEDEDENGDDDGDGVSGRRAPNAHATSANRRPPAQVVVVDDDFVDEQDYIVQPPPRRQAIVQQSVSVEEEQEEEEEEEYTVPPPRKQATSRRIIATTTPLTARRRPFDESNDDISAHRGSSSTSNMPCFTCGEKGHWAKDCPSRNSNNGSSSSNSNYNNTSNSNQTCFNCGQPGHWASHCTETSQSGPSGKRARGLGASRGSSSSRGSSTRGKRGQSRSSRY